MLNHQATVTQALFYLQLPPSFHCFRSRNLLTACVYKNNASILGYLLKFKFVSTTGADISSDLLNQDEAGNTALHYAYAFNYTAAVYKMQLYFNSQSATQPMKDSYASALVRFNNSGLCPQDMKHDGKDVERGADETVNEFNECFDFEV